MSHLFEYSKKEQPAAKYAFPNEDDEQEDTLNIQAKQPAYGTTSSSHQSASYSASKYDTTKQAPSHPPPAGPSVLDKFGKWLTSDRKLSKPDIFEIHILIFQKT